MNILRKDIEMNKYKFVSSTLGNAKTPGDRRHFIFWNKCVNSNRFAGKER